jgi:hypothetical protein
LGEVVGKLATGHCGKMKRRIKIDGSSPTLRRLVECEGASNKGSVDSTSEDCTSKILREVSLRTITLECAVGDLKSG